MNDPKRSGLRLEEDKDFKSQKAAIQKTLASGKDVKITFSDGRVEYIKAKKKKIKFSDTI